MISKGIQETILEMVKQAKKDFNDSLEGIVMFGSGNNKEFIEGISDLDFIYVFNHINYDILKRIKNLRNQIQEKSQCKVDIKPFTLEEFNASLEDKGAFELFTGWGLKMMCEGHQAILYSSDNFNVHVNISEDRFKRDALDRAHYYVTKLRKIFSSEDKYLLRGEMKFLDANDKIKLSVSAMKNILVFCLAHRGIFCKDVSEVSNNSLIFNEFPEIKKFIDLKERGNYDETKAIKAYNAIEKIYARALI